MKEIYIEKNVFIVKNITKQRMIFFYIKNIFVQVGKIMFGTNIAVWWYTGNYPDHIDYKVTTVSTKNEALILAKAAIWRQDNMNARVEDLLNRFPTMYFEDENIHKYVYKNFNQKTIGVINDR